VNKSIECFLLAATPQLSTDQAERLRQLIPDVDWRLLLQQAVDHRLMPLVCHNLQQQAADLVPASIMQHLQQLVQKNKLRSLALNAEMFRVLDLLGRSGVPTVPYKGGLLSQIAYGAPDRRSYEDLDILVSAADFQAPREILKARQYNPHRYSVMKERWEQKYCHWFGEYSMVNPESNIWIDVHHRLVAGDCSIPTNFSNAWQHLETVTMMGRSVQTLKREDLLLYLCVSGTKDGWSYLRSVADIAALVGNNPDLDWQDVLTQAKQLGTQRMLAVGLTLAAQLFALPIPEMVRPIIAKEACRVKLIVKPVVKRLCSGERPDRDGDSTTDKVELRWQSLERWSDRGWYAWRSGVRVFKLAAHITSRDQHFLRLPTQLYFLYYVLRPIRIINGAITKIAAVAARS
jgi:hypothetical protein